MEEHQVIIVGSGPAGSACAKALKEEDVEVLIIEKDKLPRHKTCSGILFGQTQVWLKKFLGTLPPEDIYCTPKVIQASNIVQWHKDKGFSNYVWELPKDGQDFPRDYLNVWRNNFDFWLLKETGAEYRENSTLRNFSFQDGKIQVEVAQKDQGTSDLSCSYLVGADGGNSRVKTILDPDWDKQAQELITYQAYYRFSDMGSLEDDHWYVFFLPEIGDTFSGLHRKDDFLTLVVCSFKGRSLKDSMEAYKTFLADNFNVVLEEMGRDEGIVFRLAMPYLGKDNVVLAGDAAGLGYLNGEAISAALDSGYRAGKAIAQAMKTGGNAAEIYQSNAGDILGHMQLCMDQANMFATP